MLGWVAHVFNPYTGGAVARRSLYVQIQPGLPSKFQGSQAI